MQFKFDDFKPKVGFLNQDAQLFEATIRDNVSFWSDKNDPSITERVKLACKLAGISDFIDSLPLKYDTAVSEQGASLSGGQRQRICLARELFKNPDILFMDEATSALDVESEHIIKGTLKALIGQTTIILVTHSRDLIPVHSRIFALIDGKVCEQKFK